MQIDDNLNELMRLIDEWENKKKIQGADMVDIAWSYRNVACFLDCRSLDMLLLRNRNISKI